MAFNIDTATEKDYINLVLQPSKLRNLARVLYLLAQRQEGNSTSASNRLDELTELTDNIMDNIDLVEDDIATLNRWVNQAFTEMADIWTEVENLTIRVEDLEQRFT